MDSTNVKKRYKTALKVNYHISVGARATCETTGPTTANKRSQRTFAPWDGRRGGLGRAPEAEWRMGDYRLRQSAKVTESRTVKQDP